jgi:hypothetical protein
MPPRAAAAVPRGQVLLVLQAGFAEMHLAVDGAGQHVQTPGIDALGGAGAAEVCRWRRSAPP